MRNEDYKHRMKQKVNIVEKITYYKRSSTRRDTLNVLIIWHLGSNGKKDIRKSLNEIFTAQERTVVICCITEKTNQITMVNRN